MSGSLAPLFFWLIAIVTVLSALAVVLVKNIFHSALFLVVSFLGIAGIYALLEAGFLAAVQILIYAGAIAVFIIFAIMLVRQGDISKSSLFNRYVYSAGAVCIAFAVGVIFMIVNNDFDIVSTTGEQSLVAPIGVAIMTDYIIPFEIVAILLLVAFVGANLLVKGVKRNG